MFLLIVPHTGLHHVPLISSPREVLMPRLRALQDSACKALKCREWVPHEANFCRRRQLINSLISLSPSGWSLLRCCLCTFLKDDLVALSSQSHLTAASLVMWSYIGSSFSALRLLSPKLEMHSLIK